MNIEQKNVECRSETRNRIVLRHSTFNIQHSILLKAQFPTIPIFSLHELVRCFKIRDLHILCIP
jgi:hypothetical protein